MLTAQSPEPEWSPTSEPDWAPTGKLNQFRGYVTPRPFPANADILTVYASVWAAWSAWSICRNGVRMRVRACNTVKGFNCPGQNKELMPCDPNARHLNLSPGPSDYDAFDPYEADRLEAMRQLYPDMFPPDKEEQKNPNFSKIPKLKSEHFRAHAAVPLLQLYLDRKQNQSTEGPSKISTLLKDYLHIRLKSKEHSLGRLPNFAPINDSFGLPPYAFEHVPPLGIHLPSVAATVAEAEVERSASPSMRRVGCEDPVFAHASDNLKPPKTFFIGITACASLWPCRCWETASYALTFRCTVSKQSLRIRGSSEEEEQLRLHREEVEAAINSLHIREEGRSNGKVDRQPDVRVWDPSELVEPVKKTRGSSDFSKKRFNSQGARKAIVEEKNSLKEQGPIVGELWTKSEGTTIKEVREEDLLEEGVEGHETMTVVTDEQAKATSTITTSNTNTEAPISTTTMEEPEETVFTDEDHFEQFGTLPRVVQPQLNSNDIDEDAVPEVVVPVPTEPPLPAELPTSTTTERITTKRSTNFKLTTPLPTATVTIELPTTLDTLELTDAQKDLIDERTLMEPVKPVTHKVHKSTSGVSKAIPQTSIKTKKTKSFGFTGFAVRKTQFTSKKSIHEGDVTTKTIPMLAKVTTVPVTTRSTSRRPTVFDEDMSPDTLHALDWMLQNITKIAEQGDEAFLAALKQSSVEQRDPSEIVDITRPTIATISSDATMKRKKVGKKLRKIKKFKKTRKLGVSNKRKGEKLSTPIIKIHSGELKPLHVDKNKMFPKFKSKVTAAIRARAFGIRTVNEDKDDTQLGGLDSEIEAFTHKDVVEGESPGAAVEDPVHLMQEIEELQDMIIEDVERVVAAARGLETWAISSV
ncbi:unnamed protein product [Cylicocyclus nassatus]|uniref:Uncharacterized protein n=1 Tax=Cylicocyclus nassatus TaxID=53992 RepID=A0AA36GPS0_CYLNA|nr:unnamed protein product [Cylicocyclus nassatus]